MPTRYAPARDDGMKPWHVTITDFGQKRERIVWAKDRSAAEYEAKGRMRYVYAKARRATPADLEVLNAH